MRIDKFLWFVRITKTRADAAVIADSGHIRIDGRRIDRAHALVRPGDTITMPIHDNIRVLRIDHLPHRRGPPVEACGCYTDMAVDGARPQT